MFSSFHYVKYTDFMKHGKLPISGAGLTKWVVEGVKEITPDQNGFIVFMSHRWIVGNEPDDKSNS